MNHETLAIINYVHDTLCNRDKRDRKAGRNTKWQSLEDIIKKMRAFPQTLDIWYLAKFILKDKRGFIERHLKNFKVRLTKKGRKRCGQRLREE